MCTVQHINEYSTVIVHMGNESLIFYHGTEKNTLSVINMCGYVNFNVQQINQQK